MTTARKAMVRPRIDGPQLPAPVGDTEFVILNAVLEQCWVRKPAFECAGYC